MDARKITVSNSTIANQKLASQVKQVLSQNPTMTITYVVPNYRLGSQIVSQVNRHIISSGEVSLVGVEQITAADLLALLAQQADMVWNFADFSQKLAQLVSQRLFREGEFGAAQNLMPSTVIAITSAVSNFNWIDLENQDVYKNLDSDMLTPTSRRILQFTKQIQSELNQTDAMTPARMLVELSSKIGSLKASGVREVIGHVIQLDIELAESFSQLLFDLVGASNLTQIELGSSSSPKPDFVSVESLSFPDVFTEVRYATKKVVDFLVASKNPLDVAVLYSDSKDYLTTLTSVLDDAGIDWYGPSKAVASNARVAILTKDILEYAASPLENHFDRKTVMRCIRSRILASPDKLPEDFSWHQVERYVKNSGLFNDAEKWLPELDLVAAGLPELLDEFEQAKKDPDDTEYIDDVKRKVTHAYSAMALVKLIRSVRDFKDALYDRSNPITEGQASGLLINLINSLIGNKSVGSLPSLDRRAWSIIQEALSLGFGDPDEKNQNHAKVLLTKITEALSSKGAFKSGSGVFIGDIRQHPMTSFKYLVVVGCSEGALPNRVLEDPLVPDLVREALPEGLKNVLPTSSRSSAIATSIVSSIMLGAEHLALAFSRSGLVGTGSGKASPLLRAITLGELREVSSFEQYVDLQENAVLKSDLSRKANLISNSGNSSAEVEAAISIYSGQYTNYFGKVSSTLPAYDFADGLLSPSAVESFLKCPHKFLVSYGFGFFFEDDTDEIEDYRANDFGTMVHSAWERLFEECASSNALPQHGEPFSTEAKNRFREIFEQEIQAARNKGQSGWEPLFVERSGQFLKNIDLYFELEHQHRSRTPVALDKNDVTYPLRDALRLRPERSEFSFDSDGAAPLRVDVPTPDGVVQMRFKGRMDRLDLSLNRFAAGVLDFKTTSADRIRQAAGEVIQDLLYGHAMRHNVEYNTIQLVTFHYLTMKADEESQLVNLRPAPKALFLEESNGGLPESEVLAAVAEYNGKLDDLLYEKLTLLLRAARTGNFPPNPYSTSAEYCEVCKQIGLGRAKKIATEAQTLLDGEQL